MNKNRCSQFKLYYRIAEGSALKSPKMKPKSKVQLTYQSNYIIPTVTQL